MAIIVKDSDDNKYVYLLKHETDNNLKIIGIFSEIEIAENAIDSLINEAYFNEYPIDKFKIEKVQLNKNNYEETPLVFKV